MNYMRILSKTSLKSSSSVKSFPPEEQIKSQSEVENLRQTIEALKHTIESRDAAIGTLAREKEKLYVELKSAQRTIRNLHQQLEDERNMHDKEKDFLIEEIKRLSKKSERHNTENKNDGVLEFNRLKEELRTKDEIIYNICAKYMKMKSSKTFLFQELTKLQSQNEKACEDVMDLLQENKKSVDQILSKLIECSNIPPSSKHFLKILRTNANLHFENTQLKVRLTSSVPKQFIIDNCFDEKKYQQDRFMKMLINKHEKRMKVQASRNSVPLNTAENAVSINCSKSSIPCTRTIYKSFSDSRLVNVRK